MAIWKTDITLLLKPLSREEGEWGEVVQEFSRGYRTWSLL